MAFTAGSVELAKATKLANQLSSLYQTFGATNMSGLTAIQQVEDYAQKLGFGITGLTTGGGFPPFGSVLPSLGLGVAAALQNPRGETMANGIVLGAIAGATVGIYMHKFVRSGEDYRAIVFNGLTLADATTTTGTTFSIRGGQTGFTAHTNDLIVIGQNTYKIVSGITNAAVNTGKAEVTVSTPIGVVFAAGAILNIETVGVTRGTAGIAGSTFESFRGGNAVNGGFTACVFFGGASGSTGTIS
jgi:hypothetical protein